MSRRLSDDEKRVFSDQISLLKNENERLTDRIEELETDSAALEREIELRDKGELTTLQLDVLIKNGWRPPADTQESECPLCKETMPCGCDGG